jgi:hypothetical protein
MAMDFSNTCGDMLITLRSEVRDLSLLKPEKPPGMTKMTASSLLPFGLRCSLSLSIVRTRPGRGSAGSPSGVQAIPELVEGRPPGFGQGYIFLQFYFQGELWIVGNNKNKDN